LFPTASLTGKNRCGSQRRSTRSTEPTSSRNAASKAANEAAIYGHGRWENGHVMISQENGVEEVQNISRADAALHEVQVNERSYGICNSIIFDFRPGHLTLLKPFI
jgi:hypothetical protein